MIRAQLVGGGLRVEVSGMDTSELPGREWRKGLVAMGEALQAEVAASFAKEKVAGSSELRTYKEAWGKRKARLELDPRRGHATNRLQNALESQRLFTVSSVGKDGRGSITMEPSRLYAAVDYAEHYEAAKVRVATGILTLTKKWVQAALVAVLEKHADAAIRKAKRGKAPKNIRQKSLRREAEKIGRQARRDLTPAQRAQIEELAKRAAYAVGRSTRVANKRIAKIG